MKKWKKEIKNAADKEMLSRRCTRDKNGSVIIHMSVDDDANFLSVFAENSTPVIAGEVAEFLEHITDAVPAKEPLALHIHSNCIDENEQTTYRSAIQEYYTEKYIANERELRRNHRIAMALAIAGTLVLVFAAVLSLFSLSGIGAEVIDIVAWVLLWEAVDISLLASHNLRVKRQRYLSFMAMSVEYYPAK